MSEAKGHSPSSPSSSSGPSSSGGRPGSLAPDAYRIGEGALWASAWKVAAGVGALGLLGAGAGFASDPRRFAFSWLFAFAVFFTVAIGAMFFVVLQHLVGASWSVTVRRTAEFFMHGMIPLTLLFLPVVLSKDHLYGEWMHHGAAGHGASHASQTGEALLGPSVAQAQDHGHDHPPGEGHDHAAGGHDHAAEGSDHAGGHDTPQHALHGDILDHKQPFLNTTAWLLRAVFYFAVWLLIGWFYFSRSTRQDASRDLQETVAMQRWAPISMIAFALTMTFAAFDWIMSLEAAWYSTIFGVCIFAGSVVTIHALVSLVTLSFRKYGLIGDAVNVEHYHDLGKLTFGFVVFWAYVSFSQMMLIWYAGIPEEAVYYHLRWGDHGWTGVSLFLVFGHFVLPFLFLISRDIKRRLGLYGFGVAWLLVVHVVDMYWYVMPHFDKGVLAGHWMDFACLVGVGGVYLAWVFYWMTRHPLIPIGDPRLSRSLHFQNA